MRILALKWRRLGDTILWTAALEALRRHLPQARIDLAVPAPYLTLFSDDHRWGKRFGLERGWRQQAKLVGLWRRERYDLALGFHVSSRSGLLLRLAGAGETVRHHHGRDRHASPQRSGGRPIPGAGVAMPATERDINVVRALGWRGESPPTELRIAETTRDSGRALLSSAGCLPARPLILVGPGASRPAKRWPLERYARLCRLLREKFPDVEVAVVVESALQLPDRYFRRELERHARVILTPRLAELMGVVANASLYIGSDSGVKHLACAVGVPTVTLFGPESVGEWHPYDRTVHKVFQRPVLCRDRDPQPPEYAWCGVERCPFSSHACMTLISPEDVVDAIESL